MARARSLVCQHLENVSKEVLRKYQDLIKDFFRGRHGVYALYRGDQLYYVGLASNLRSRLHQHLSDRHARHWNRFSAYLIIDDKHVKEVESLVLRIMRPKGNRTGGRLAKSENLLPSLRASIRVRQREELGEITGRRPRRKASKRQPRRIADPGALAGVLPKGTALRSEYKGKIYRAVVRADGWVRHSGHAYRSPGLVASEIVGRRVNGWSFWKYQRAPGDWVSIRSART